MVQAAAPASKQFLLRFIQKHKYLSFCFQELESIAKMLRIPPQLLYPTTAGQRPQ